MCCQCLKIRAAAFLSLSLCPSTAHQPYFQWASLGNRSKERIYAEQARRTEKGDSKKWFTKDTLISGKEKLLCMPEHWFLEDPGTPRQPTYSCILAGRLAALSYYFGICCPRQEIKAQLLSVRNHLQIKHSMCVHACIMHFFDHNI